MTTPCKYVCDNKTSEGYCKTTGCINPNYSQLQCARVPLDPLDPLDQKDDMDADKKGKTKTFNLTVSYSGDAKNWDEIKIDAENEKIKHVFIGKKEFVNVVYCEDCRYANECSKSVQYTRNEPNAVTIGYPPIKWCSRGERRR